MTTRLLSYIDIRDLNISKAYYFIAKRFLVKTCLSVRIQSQTYVRDNLKYCLETNLHSTMKCLRELYFKE